MRQKIASCSALALMLLAPLGLQAAGAARVSSLLSPRSGARSGTGL